MTLHTCASAPYECSGEVQSNAADHIASRTLALTRATERSHAGAHAAAGASAAHALGSSTAPS